MASHKIRIGEREGCRNGDLSPDATMRLPYRMTTGYDKLTAKRGDFIVAQEGDSTVIGRVLGVVTPCERMPEDRCARYVAVLTLSHDGHCAFARWIDPADVRQCRAPRGTPDFAAWFFGNDLSNEAPDRIMRQCKSGALSCDYFANRERY